MTGKQGLLTLLAVLTLGLTIGTTSVKADEMKDTAVETVQDEIKENGLNTTIENHEQEIKDGVEKVNVWSKSFMSKLDDAKDYTDNTQTKNPVKSTTNFIKILFTDTNSTEVLNEENQKSSIKDSVKAEIINENNAKDMVYALKYKLGNGGFSSVPEGRAGWFTVAITVLLAIVSVTTILILGSKINTKENKNYGNIRAKNQQINRNYTRADRKLSRFK